MIDTPKELKDFIVKILEDRNAQNITVLKLGNEVPLATYMIFASGRSIKNIAAIAEHIVYELKHNAQWPAPAERLKNSDWILLDAGDVIVHIFHPESSGKFKLEDLWNPKK